MNDCEYCAQPAGEKKIVERPMSDEAKTLSAFPWVADPSALVFCDEDCRVKWHALRRKAIWEKHGPVCMCAECTSRA